METLFITCAAIGGTILVLQTLMLMFGGGDADADMPPDGVDFDAADAIHAHAGLIHWLSFKTVVAFLAFFGFAGLAGQQAELSPSLTLVLAVGAGLGAVLMVAWMMAALARLQARGNLDLRNAVGCHGRVYLRVPAARSGTGKITVAVQGRTVECRAITAGPELSTGTAVLVRALASPSTVEVVAGR